MSLAITNFWNAYLSFTFPMNHLIIIMAIFANLSLCHASQANTIPPLNQHSSNSSPLHFPLSLYFSSSGGSSLRIQGSGFYPQFGGSSQPRSPGDVANSPRPPLWDALEDPRMAPGSGGNNMTSSSVMLDSSPFSLPIATPTDGTSPWTSFPSYWPEAAFSPLSSRYAPFPADYLLIV